MRDHRLHVSASFGIRREVEPPSALPAAAGLAVALLVALTSAIGILDPEIYARETASWRAQGIGQDWVDLLIAVPVLAITASLSLRGSRRAGLLLGAALAYTGYSFAIYAVAIHFNQLFLVYCAILGASVVGLLGLALPIARDPSVVVGERHRLASAFMIATAAVFAFAWLAEDLPAMIRGEAPASLAVVGLPSNPIHVLDLALVLPAMIAIGVRLWLRRPDAPAVAAIALGFVCLMDLNIAGINVAMVRADVGGSLALAAAFVAMAVGASVLLGGLLAGSKRAPKAR